MNELSFLVGQAEKLRPYFEDPAVSDILINGVHSIYIEKFGVLHPLPPLFQTSAQIQDVLERFLIPLGKRMDVLNPQIDGTLPDGCRLHILLSPIATPGPVISIRKRNTATSVELASFSSKRIVEHLKNVVNDKQNLLICGKTGSGKTTLLENLVNIVNHEERLVIIEDTREIQSFHPHCLYLETRKTNSEGKGEVTLQDLVKNSLRMRPDRIIIGECRGKEAWDLLLALNTGHSGSFCTLHANSPMDALYRLEGLVALAKTGLSETKISEWIGRNIDEVIFVEKQGSNRKISQILSIQGTENGRYRFIPILENFEE